MHFAKEGIDGRLNLGLKPRNSSFFFGLVSRLFGSFSALPLGPLLVGIAAGVEPNDPTRREGKAQNDKHRQ